MTPALMHELIRIQTSDAIVIHSNQSLMALRVYA
jgi:hypothetical protein